MSTAENTQTRISTLLEQAGVNLVDGYAHEKWIDYPVDSRGFHVEGTLRVWLDDTQAIVSRFDRRGVLLNSFRVDDVDGCLGVTVLGAIVRTVLTARA